MYNQVADSVGEQAEAAKKAARRRSGSREDLKDMLERTSDRKRTSSSRYNRYLS